VKEYSLRIFEGPPSANGLPDSPCNGHAPSKIFFADKHKEDSKFASGWDTGLPVELGTEKELGIIKEDIGLFPSKNITRACKTVMRYTYGMI
jgi:isoleucyl-tRNA synthetase